MTDKSIVRWECPLCDAYDEQDGAIPCIGPMANPHDTTDLERREYVAMDALLSAEAVEGGFQRVFGSVSVEAVDQANRTLVRDILTAVANELSEGRDD